LLKAFIWQGRSQRAKLGFGVSLFAVLKKPARN